jgi:hypothetical protein
MVMKFYYIYLTLLVMILSACHAPGTTTPASTIPATSTSVVDIPPPTSPIFTQIHQSLDTPFIPTRTSTTTPPPPKSTLSPQEIAGSILKELTIDKEWKPSPNGMCIWERLLGFTNTEAATLKYNNQIFEYVTVTCEPDAKKWVLVDKWAEGGLGYSIPALLGWSADGKYLYFNDKVIPDGCQPLGGFQRNLQQVNLTNGKIISIPITLTGGIVLSPSTTKLVYYDHQSVEVGYYNIETGKEQHIPFELPQGIEYWYAGDFTWSPDEQNVIFVIQWGPCSPIGVSLRRVNLETDEVTTLLETENPNVSILQWKDSNHILIAIDKKEYWLDPNTGGTVLAPECPDNCVIIPPN